LGLKLEFDISGTEFEETEELLNFNKYLCKGKRGGKCSNYVGIYE